jgi:hypothetical protein
VQKAGRVLPYLALLLWTVFLYFPAITQPFVYDDKMQILNNARFQSFHASTEFLRRSMEFAQEYETQTSAFYRPVFWMSLFADWRIWGPHPEGFHAFII